MNAGKEKYPLREWLPRVVDIADTAADRIMRIYQTDFQVDRKEDESPLTAADLASHDAICHGLRALTPQLPILSEESAAVPFAERKTWNCYWLVDPLDGTKEFISRNGEFTVNIALIEQGRPVLGVVCVPARHASFYAAAGQGAWRRSEDGAVQRIHCRRTSARHFAVAGSRSHASPAQERFFSALGPGTEIVSMGSSLKFCLVAEGRVDIYPRFGPTSEWDTAAAQCVVEEAGGIVTDTGLQPLRYNSKTEYLNPHFLVIGDPEFDWQAYLAPLVSDGRSP